MIAFISLVIEWFAFNIVLIFFTSSINSITLVSCLLLAVIESLITIKITKDFTIK